MFSDNCPQFRPRYGARQQKLQKYQPTRFGQFTLKRTAAMKALQDKLLSLPVLALPRYGLKYTLDTDACRDQVRCVLLRGQEDGTKRPIGYWSLFLNDSQRTYDATCRILYAVFWAVLQLRSYPKGSKFTIRTYLDSLK